MSSDRRRRPPGSATSSAMPRRRPAARARAATAVLDTVGVTLAGASEPASRIVRQVVAAEGGDACGVFGTAVRASMSGAALANGTAAHALDYDDMCFVSLAHPSAPLVPAVLAAAESERLTGRAVLDAYVVGFEIEARLGRLMNPRHYQRGWHCTSTLGTIGAAAAVSRLLGLDARRGGSRARDRRVRGVRPEGELRDDGQAAACGAGGAQRRARGAAGQGRDDGERARARRPAGIPARDGQRGNGARATRSRISARAGRSSTPASR